MITRDTLRVSIYEQVQRHSARLSERVYGNYEISARPTVKLENRVEYIKTLEKEMLSAIEDRLDLDRKEIKILEFGYIENDHKSYDMDELITYKNTQEDNLKQILREEIDAALIQAQEDDLAAEEFEIKREKSLSSYITGQEVCDQYKISNFDLFNSIKYGLQPYNYYGFEPCGCPDFCNQSWITLVDGQKKYREYLKSLEMTVEKIIADKKEGTKGTLRYLYTDIEETIKNLKSYTEKIKVFKKADWKDVVIPVRCADAKKFFSYILTKCYKKTDISILFTAFKSRA